MSGAPDWRDGECCFRCRTQFTLVARKHHCRNCGNIFCAKCSSQQIPLPNLNIEKNVRVCDSCYDKISSKNTDPLTLAIDKNSDTPQAKTKMNSKSTEGNSKSSTSNKPAANASAPSEQELKEEEELQLALALSLSEAPAKISFPDCRQFEENNVRDQSLSSHSVRPTSSNGSNAAPLKSVITSSAAAPTSLTTTSTNVPTTATATTTTTTTQPNLSAYPDPSLNVFSSEQQTVSQPHYQQESHVILDRDQELFKFVAEVQSTAEKFTNRISTNKFRNRPIADDTAIQGLFLKLTNMHAKLLEYIKIHDEERSGLENVQDKLSQISDARAALDALREEHQEKVRQEAAEAERQRQSQLASKLEMMRQKKSQMMQYQREVALQRIQAQEIMLRQPQVQQMSSSATIPQQVPQPSIPPQISIQQVPKLQNLSMLQEQLSNQQPVIQQQHQPPPPASFQQPSFQQHGLQNVQQYLPNLVNQPMQQQQSLPTVPKIDDEAPLISFDD